MSRYPDARRIVVTLADLRRLTILEKARVGARAGVADREWEPLLRTAAENRATPEEELQAATLLYAVAYELERRILPGTSWEEAQSWDLAWDLRDATADPIADAEARASVEAALGTGLPPAIAGELTLAHLEAYGTVRREAERKRTRGGYRRR